MIARIRGDHDTRWGRWRPDATHESSATRAQSTDLPQRVPQAAPKRWGVWRFVAAGASIAVACVAAAGSFSSTPGRAQLPATPRAWLDAYEAAAIDNPARVCSELFEPRLARAYGKALHSSCRTYFSHITSLSVVVRRVFADGRTAVLELHQTVRPRDWAVVLSHRPHGWQAVDLLAGSFVR
jgi:hypothetical protein